ncbi:MAG: hypothetical protein R3F62_08080 [Planctomycetota bacterium]
MVARLQALAEAGLRADDPSAATISDTLRSQERLGVLDSMTYWAAIRACARLDLPCAPEVFRTTPGIGGAPRERPWDLDTREPWARYLEARIARARSVPGSDAALASALRGDFAELLGPVHWTQSALEVAAALSPREQRPWIEEAVQRAPALPLPWVYLAGIQLEEGHPQQALASLERATGILGSPGYAGAFATEASLRRAHHYTIVALAELGRRDEARALYRLHAGRNPSFAAPLLEPYPWLDD